MKWMYTCLETKTENTKFKWKIKKENQQTPTLLIGVLEYSEKKFKAAIIKVLIWAITWLKGIKM